MKRISVLLLGLIASSAFAQTKISELPAADPLNGAEAVPIVQPSGTVKTTTQEIADLAAATPPGGSTTQVQYNNAGAFAGIPGVTYTVGTGVLALSPTGGNVIGSATGGAQGAGSINAQALYINGEVVPTGAVSITTGTFTATWETACTTNPTQNWKWIKIGTLVTLTALQGFTCTSDSTTFTASGALPAAIRPDAHQRVIGLAATDNGTPDVQMACLHVEPDGSISVRRSVTAPCVGTPFTNTGTKAFTIQSDSGPTPQGPQTFTYDVDVL